MVPEKYKHHLFNDWDYFPQNYKCDDPEKEELIKKLTSMITLEMTFKGKPDKVETDNP